jgi:hypothetical protein
MAQFWNIKDLLRLYGGRNVMQAIHFLVLSIFYFVCLVNT